MIKNFYLNTVARKEQPSRYNVMALLALASIILLSLMLPATSAIPVVSTNDSVSIETATYKSNVAVDLKIQCISNNAYCNSTTVCNVTVTNPINSVVVNNGLMTNSVSYHNYTLSATNVLTQGTYNANVLCWTGTTNMGPTVFGFEITPSGLSSTLGYFIIIFLVAYGIGFFGYFGKNEWIAVAGGLAMISLGIYTLINGIDVYRTTMTEVLSWWTIGVGAIFAIHASVSLIEENM